MKKWLKVRKLAGAIILLLFVVAINYSSLLAPVDRLIYDSQLRFSERAPLDDIVIVAIDKASLDEIGRWPWNRDVHATFLEKLALVNPKAVIMDILFSEPSNQPEYDQLLANAISNNKKVVLPVAVESLRGISELTENLPLPLFQNGVAGIGHVNRELDVDAISRTSYLYAGLSDSINWPSIALEAIWVAGRDPFIDNEYIFPEDNYINGLSSASWTRSERYLLPFVGKPGTFTRISYAQVLQENFDLKQLDNKFVLVGTTAVGLGDVVSTPVSGERHPMPGIEVIANEIDSLRQGLLITQIGNFLGFVITVSFVLFSFLLWNFLPPRYSLFCAGGLILLIIAANALVLHTFRVWFPPANLILGVAIGYLGWIWWRLVETVRYLNSELTRLGNVSMPFFEVNPHDGNRAFNYLMNMNGFYKGLIKDHQNNTLFEWNKPDPPESKNATFDSSLTIVGKSIERNNDNWELSLFINEKEVHRADAECIANQLSAYYKAESKEVAKSPVEFINNRIELVKSAYSKMHSMNHFVNEIFDQLYNSVIVTDSFGNLIMANRGSDKLLNYNENKLDSLNILNILDGLVITKPVNWHDVFSNVMFVNQEFVVEAMSQSGKFLLVEVTRYSVDENLSSGMVFNFIDVTALKETEQSRRELLAFLSHDLRSPLASLIATSDLAKIRPEYRESETFIKSIKDNAKRALQLADDFLALMRAESISSESFEPVNMNQVIANSIASVESSASVKKITVTNLVNNSFQQFVRGDKSVLERVIINLLSNAIKYSPISRTIEVGLRIENNELHCWVQDNGFGIRQQDQQKVFKRFERINHRNKHEDGGTGLGLAFVKSSIERHKGRIILESQIDKGSCFHIYLPLLEESLSPISSTKVEKELKV